jgi:hypothetical protein
MRTSVKIFICIFWVLMSGWLIRYELFPEKFTHTLSGYRGLLSSGPLIVDNWMKIEYDGAHVGYSHSNVDTVEGDPDIQYQVRNKTVLYLNMLGSIQRILVESTADLDPVYRLQRIHFSMRSRQYNLKLAAERKAGQQFDVQMTTDAGKQTFSVEIPDDAIVYSPMLEMSLKELAPGDEMNIRLYEPVSMTPQNVLVRALRKETLSHRGEEVETTVLESKMKGMSALSWLDKNGKTLRQETPMGWNMVESSPEEALKFSAQAEKSNDILRSMAVPSKGVIVNQKDLKKLEIRLFNASLEAGSLVSGRQEVLREDDSGIYIQLTPGAEFGLAQPDELGDPSAYLEATPFVQSDHVDIQKKARQITRGAVSTHAQILSLYHWVNKSIKKNPTISLPSALDVLKTGEGDCNEHTYLMVALARSMGIPARIQIGLVYNQGAFYYHAWPALHDGEAWYEMDPTIGQPRVDASHLAILNGEIGDQLALLGLIGRMEIEIMTEHYE